jgi:hypothetical protein
MTLGPALLALAWLDGRRLAAAKPLLALSYPLCRWFAGVKQRRRD